MEEDERRERRTAAAKPRSAREPGEIRADEPEAGAPGDPRSRARLRGASAEPRYRLRQELGRGGMGEVHLARDERIGRTVALKVMLGETAEVSDLQRRFLREARVQAQLEHPAIVPVHDLDWDAEGRAYFVMKRISGVTLREVLLGLRRRDPSFEAQHSTRRLLGAFQQVCLAIDYAHARGIVHRDIKPSNLMLGDFGEVYVLDWGIAKVTGEDEAPISRVDVVREPSHTTRQGELLGTVGYMAPEQLDDAPGVDRRADVYSLGAVLFEILALEPLHAGATDADREHTTRHGVDAAPSLRAPDRDIPAELDRVCRTATEADPKDRYPTARALHDAIQDFLEGDRDLRLRAELAAQHVAAARAHAQRALGDGAHGAEATDARRHALSHAGRALALDDSHEEATAILARLVLEPPKELPKDVRAAMRSDLHSEMSRGLRLGSVALALFTLVAVGTVSGGVRSWVGLAGIVVPLLVTGIYAAFVGWANPPRFKWHAVALAVPVSLAIAGGSSLFGPLLFAPMFAVSVAAMVSALEGLGRERLIMIGLLCTSVVAPMALEWGGWLPPAYRFEHGAMTILPQAITLSEAQARLALGAGNLVVILFVSAIMWRYASWVAESRERTQLYAWHLESLAPKEGAVPAPRSPEPPGPN